MRKEQSKLVLSQLLGAARTAGVASDRRNVRDRRKLTFWSVLYGGFRPRRRQQRRTDDGTLPVVDWHDAHLLAVSIVILLLSCADAFLTLNLLLLGVAHEANPFMARLIATDITLFTVVKMALTGGGILVMVLLSRYRLFGRFPVVKTLYGVLIGYGVLILYQLTLLAHAT